MIGIHISISVLFKICQKVSHHMTHDIFFNSRRLLTVWRPTSWDKPSSPPSEDRPSWGGAAWASSWRLVHHLLPLLRSPPVRPTGVDVGGNINGAALPQLAAGNLSQLSTISTRVRSHYGAICLCSIVSVTLNGQHLSGTSYNPLIGMMYTHYAKLLL